MKIIMRIRQFFLLHFYWLRKPEIRVYEASLSGNGSFIDIRYWLSRPDKINSKGSIYIVNEDTGAKLYLMQIAKFGTIHTHHSKFHSAGNLLIFNRNNLAKHGSKVTLHFDDLTATDIMIN